jgi:hypothetical protein
MARMVNGYDYFSGTVSSDGKGGITWVSGDKFDTGWGAMTTMVVDGVSYPIASVADDQHLNLAVAAMPGVTGVSYSLNLVPEELKLAIKFLAAHWYENREPVVIGRGVTSVEVARTVDSLIDCYRVNTMGFNQTRASGQPSFV